MDGDMADVLAEAEVRQLGLLSSVLTDEDSRARIAAIVAAQKAHDEAYARLGIQNQVQQDLLRETQKRLNAALEQERYNKAYKDQLDQREKTMADVQTAINKEKAAWEAIRQKVDAEQTDLAKRLAAKANSLNSFEAELISLQDHTEDIRGQAAAMKAKYAAMIEDLKAVMEKHGA
jgi:hypothetical protein